MLQITQDHQRYLSCHALQKMKKLSMLFALFMLLCSGEEVEDSSIVDLGFKQEIGDMNEQINSLLGGFAVDNNSTADWTFVTFIILVPLRCSVVNSIVAQFDDAMGKANPAAGITSVARRLGAMPCDNSVCPCVDDSRRTTRVMEVQSRSRSPHVEFPKAFPYRVDLQTAEELDEKDKLI